MLLIQLGLMALLAAPTVDSSKILALMTARSHSHHFWNTVYLEALAKKGHDITYLGVDPYKNKPDNIRFVLMENGYDFNETADFTEMSQYGAYTSVMGLNSWQEMLGNLMAESEGFKEFLGIVKTEKFDLVVFDLASSSFLLGVVDLVGKPPAIGITAFSIPAFSLGLTGTPYPVANNAHMYHRYGKDMTFWERFDNAGIFLFDAIYHSCHLKDQEAFSKKFFGPSVRPLPEIFDELTINIVNGNWATDLPFPIAPGLIPIAGLHIKEPKPLPKELQQYLDSSPNGVVFFSLGSNIPSSLMSEHVISTLTAAFRKLAPVKVLWKWEKDVLPGKPDNVRIEKWLPQNDILAHPNVKLFFTHGGMLSTQEAMYHGIPIVGMPIFLDQHVNVKKAVEKGIGEALELTSITVDGVVQQIQKVLSEPKYAKTMKDYSILFRDQQNVPLDTAVYWTEYAIRHNGAPHLRPASKKLSWFASGLYDILAVVLVAVVIVCKIVVISIRLLWRSLKKKVKTD